MLEHDITGLVTEGVVDMLEVIQVGQRDPQRKAVPSRATHLPAGPFLNGTPVRQARQGVGKSQLFQQAIPGFELSLQTDDSLTHLSPS